jgi:chemotaxis signal transduction protein
MKASPEGLEQRLDDLRRSFDESFAVPSWPEEIDQEDMLGIQVGSGQFAVRVSELAGVHASRKIVGLPGAIVGLLGVVGIRGKLVAAYRLSDLLGSGSAEGRPRWMLVCRGDSHVGLTIEALDGYMRVSSSLVHAARNEEGLSEHVREILQHKGVTRGVLSISSILATIMRRANVAPQPKES